MNESTGNGRIEVDGVEIHVEGEGPQTVVMIHGWPDTWRLWDAQVATFKPHFRCVRFTLPGFDIHGPRRAHSLAELIEFFRRVVLAACPDGRAILMVHDWGAVFGYQFAMKHPELVSKIVGVDIGDTVEPAYVQSLKVSAKLAVFLYQSWLAIAWRIGGALGDRMTRKMMRALKVPSDPALAGSCMNYPYYIQWTGTHGSYRHLSPVRPACPMLFIYGRKKPFLFHSPEWAAMLSRDQRNQVVPLDTRHWVMVEQPEAFNAAVLGWLGAS
jgi:pimeloyl-ACP methyl ester carboxylesterase